MTGKARERERLDELLSAYIDGQLGAGERARLEARLATDPALGAELEALRRTVALVRELPPVPVPRNFFLARAMAAPAQPVHPPRPRRAWVAPFLTAATAAVSLVFAVVLAGYLLLAGTGMLGSAPAAEQALEVEAPRVALAPSPVAEEAVAETVVVEAEVEEVEAEKVAPVSTPLTAPVEVPAGAPPEASPEAAEVEGDEVAALEAGPSPEPGMGGGGPAEETTPRAPASVAPGAEEPAAPPPAAAPPVTPAPTPSPPAAGEAAEAPKAPETGTTVPGLDAGSPTPTPAEFGAVAPQVIEEEDPAATEGRRDVPEREAALRTGISPWRVLEAILGLCALGLALATVWAWRARRGQG